MRNLHVDCTFKLDQSCVFSKEFKSLKLSFVLIGAWPYMKKRSRYFLRALQLIFGIITAIGQVCRYLNICTSTPSVTFYKVLYMNFWMLKIIKTLLKIYISVELIFIIDIILSGPQYLTLQVLWAFHIYFLNESQNNVWISYFTCSGDMCIIIMRT